MHRDQVRARNAFGFVSALAQRTGAEEKDAFLGLARKLPVMLQTNGLLATWGHLLAKHGSEFREAAQALTAHLQSLALANTGTPAQLFETWIEGLAAAGLRRRTAEAIEYAVWLKRAAEALCDVTAPRGVGDHP